MSFMSGDCYRIIPGPAEYSIAQLHRAMRDTFDFLRQQGLLEDHTGGVALVVYLEAGRRWYGHSYSFVGSFEKYPASECFNIAQRKAERLCLLGETADRSAWKFRDPSMQHYGGAIIAGPPDEEFLLSFSGLTEHLDEALCLSAGRMSGILDQAGADKLMSISDNSLARDVLQALGRMGRV